MFFNYEISPLMVIHREERQSFAHFLTSTCAIVGGILTMASLIDSFVVSAFLGDSSALVCSCTTAPSSTWQHLTFARRAVRWSQEPQGRRQRGTWIRISIREVDVMLVRRLWVYRSNDFLASC